MKKVTNIITHRAMRNEASYGRKLGRAGREKNSVTNTVTILSRNPGDYQMYRNEQKLIFDDFDNPVPCCKQKPNGDAVPSIHVNNGLVSHQEL